MRIIITIAAAIAIAAAGCKNIRQDDYDRARRAAARALVETLCSQDPSIQPSPIELATRSMLCSVATAVATLLDPGAPPSNLKEVLGEH